MQRILQGLICLSCTAMQHFVHLRPYLHSYKLHVYKFQQHQQKQGEIFQYLMRSVIIKKFIPIHFWILFFIFSWIFFTQQLQTNIMKLRRQISHPNKENRNSKNTSYFIWFSFHSTLNALFMINQWPKGMSYVLWGCSTFSSSSLFNVKC